MHYNTITHTVGPAPGIVRQSRFVAFSGAQAGASDDVLGVAMTDASAGETYAAHIVGVVGVEAGGAIARGAGVVPDAQGRAITDPTASNGVAANRVGRALNAVSAAGQTVLVLIR